MARDLFAGSLDSRPTPNRSRWTIVFSILAHFGVVVALLILPVLSATTDFVVQARDLVFLSVPAMPVPPPPPPPASRASALPPDIKVDAAPRVAPEHPVVGDPPPVSSGGGTGLPGSLGAPGGFSAAELLTQGAGVRLAPPPAIVAPVRPGGNIKEPVRTVYVAPVYPPLAAKVRTEGTVILEATIDETGAVRDVRVLRSVPLLDEAAIAAVSRWRYTPTSLNGAPVPVLLTVTVTFKLR